jgi:hypothetical protein
MSLESPTTVRENLLSVIQSTPEADLPELLTIVQSFQDPATLDRRKANISKLIATLNEDDDIEEQQQALAAIRSIDRSHIDLKPDDQNYSARFNTRRLDRQS